MPRVKLCFLGKIFCCLLKKKLITEVGTRCMVRMSETSLIVSIVISEIHLTLSMLGKISADDIF